MRGKVSDAIADLLPILIVSINHGCGSTIDGLHSAAVYVFIKVPCISSD